MYFDHSATTPVHTDVQNIINNINKEIYGNPSSIYQIGQKARSAIEHARQQIAKSINTTSEKIIFTSGGTEANNHVLWSMLKREKKHIIASIIEHPAIIKVLDFLKDFNVGHSLVQVNNEGLIDINDLIKKINNDTGLISIMMANNEIGTIQPLDKIIQIAHNNGILVHSDAVQCLGKMNIDVKKLNIDFLSLSAHKFYGPKGVGALYIKNPKKMYPLIIGGNQEKSLRGGTENVSSIAGMGLAAEISINSIKTNITHLKSLEKQFKTDLNLNFKKIIFNGNQIQKIPGLLSVTFPGNNSNIILIKLDRQGIYVSNGSACGAGDIKPSPVLSAIGINNHNNLATLRFSFGKSNSLKEINFLVQTLKKVISH
tara:strand:+ start:1462 stop:2574 length:1113 start_codon:yes stop_codon:yes gene_type:complete